MRKSKRYSPWREFNPGRRKGVLSLPTAEADEHVLQLFDELSRGKDCIEALKELGYEVKRLPRGIEIYATGSA